MGQKIEIKRKIESVQYHSPDMNGTVVFKFDNNNGVFLIGSGEYEFRTCWSQAGNNSIYAYGSIGVKEEEHGNSYDEMTFEYHIYTGLA